VSILAREAALRCRRSDGHGSIIIMIAVSLVRTTGRRRLSHILGIAMTLVLLAGCQAAVPVVLRVVMSIATQILVKVGAEYVEELISPDETVSAEPVIRITHSDASGAVVTTTYQIAKAQAISVSAIEGDVLLQGNGRIRSVTVAPGSAATIEISGAVEIDVQMRAPTNPIGQPSVSKSPRPRPTTKVTSTKSTTTQPAQLPEPEPSQTEPSPTDPPNPNEPPQITSHSTYVEGQLVYLSVRFADPDGDAEGFWFRGVNGSGWAPESHPFASPSYGRVSPGRLDYPFNHLCGTGYDVETDVELAIYDTAGHESPALQVHLTCS
jgi:hypothetical protein